MFVKKQTQRQKAKKLSKNRHIAFLPFCVHFKIENTKKDMVYKIYCIVYCVYDMYKPWTQVTCRVEWESTVVTKRHSYGSNSEANENWGDASGNFVAGISDRQNGTHQYECTHNLVQTLTNFHFYLTQRGIRVANFTRSFARIFLYLWNTKFTSIGHVWNLQLVSCHRVTYKQIPLETLGYVAKIPAVGVDPFVTVLTVWPGS